MCHPHLEDKWLRRVPCLTHKTCSTFLVSWLPISFIKATLFIDKRWIIVLNTICFPPSRSKFVPMYLQHFWPDQKGFRWVPSRELIWISSTNYKPQASLHQQQLNVLFSYYKSPSKLLPSLSHTDQFIILPNQFILGQTIVLLQVKVGKSNLFACNPVHSSYVITIPSTEIRIFLHSIHYCGVAIKIILSTMFLTFYI